MKRWMLLAAAAVIVAASVVGIVASRREVSARRAEAERLGVEAQQWKAKAEAAVKELEALRAEQGLEPAEHAERATPQPKATDDSAVRRELVKLLAEKDEKLSAVSRELEQWRAQAEEFEQKVRTLTEETQKLTASERDARDQ